MSEQIKSTLFRFATMRSPELLTEKQRIEYHIHHPDPTGEGFFYTQLATPEINPVHQLEALADQAEIFSALGNKQALIDLAGSDIFDFAVWLAKHRNEVYDQKVITYVPGIPTALNHSQEIEIWDNVFYQVITGNDPLLRELLIEVLVANGYVKADEAIQFQLAVARVIIPVSFFGPDSASYLSRVTNISSDTPPVYTEHLQQIAAAVTASEKIMAYQNLQQELKEAEKIYDTSNNLVFKDAKKDYAGAIKDAIDTYYDANSTTDDTRTNDAPGESIDVPIFNFTPAAEMEAVFLEDNLSEKANALAVELDLPGNVTFRQAQEKINSLINEQAIAVEKASQQENRSVLINNMVFPAGRVRFPLTTPYAFILSSYQVSSNHYSITCIINTDPGVHAVSCFYTAALSSGSVGGTAFSETINSGALVLTLFPGGSLVIPGEQAPFHFFGEIHTSAGFKLSFDLTLNLASQVYGVMVIGKDGAEPTLNAPAGYGIKRLGLADYRKVEQSVCCYLPGEVSHIENIMAREYKERSSRRLTRSEDTSVLETSMEKETQKDSSTTERYELQKEIETVISKDSSFDSHANISGNLPKIQFDAGSSFAFNTSTEESNRTAVNYSKEVTEKALERVVQKIREERTIKIIEEFEEQNKHGFDNRLGDAHVSGVYIGGTSKRAICI